MPLGGLMSPRCSTDDDNDDGTAMTSLPTSDLNGKELLHDLKDVVCRDLYSLKNYSLSYEKASHYRPFITSHNESLRQPFRTSHDQDQKRTINKYSTQT
jgi:hypothetical protein